MWKRLKNQAGLSFIEVVLTTILVSAGFVGGSTIFSNATGTSMYNDQRVIGSQAAIEKMETIIADKKFQGYGYIVSGNYPNDSLPAPNDQYTRSVTITEVDPTDLSTPMSGSGVKKVDVQVNWGSETHEKVQMSTLVTDYS